MKAIMYHYVREYDPKFPNFRYLDIRNFIKQLDYFKKNFGFVSQEEWLKIINQKRLGNSKGKVILTFDDAMRCHYDYVYPELKKRNIWGIFYVPTQPYKKRKILDVHRIHLLCGAFSGKDLIKILLELLSDDMIPDEKIEDFREQTYTRQENYEGVSEFKRILNYFVTYEYREKLIDKLADKLNFKFNASDFYVPVENLKEMHANGNIIGSHTVNHPVMSKLDEIEQSKQIIDSFSFLMDIGFKNCKTYCHPYGGFHSFNKFTVNELFKENVQFSFNVECRDIVDDDLKNGIQFLPRFDCNQLPFGKAS